MDGIQWLSIFGGINWWSSLVPLKLPPTYIYYLDQVQCRANRGQGRYRSNTQLTVCLDLFIQRVLWVGALYIVLLINSQL